MVEHEKTRAPLERSFKKVLTPFEAFFKNQSTAGVVLLFSTVIALLLANSDYQSIYESINKLPFSIALGEWEISHSLHHWVNDGLMALFFFVLGLEIKRECLVGELSDVRQAGLVIIMAIGGMLVPALIYSLVVDTPEAMKGWGIPMATDPAFALGILAMLGRRAPGAVAIILSALAIVDDIGAVLVISIFYTEQIHASALMCAAITLGILFLGNILGIRAMLFYALGGLALWWFILHSGVHATTAGILTALVVPTRPETKTSGFIRRMRRLVNRFEKINKPRQSILEQNDQHKLAEKAQQIAVDTTTPLQHWVTALDRPVSLTILPLFAFLNAGVVLSSEVVSFTNSSVIWGVAAGLSFGKIIGISLFAWLGLRSGVFSLPSKVKFIHIVALSCLAGIGFTMSLFISTLAFEGQAVLLTQAKLGILVGSLTTGLLGIALFLIADKVLKK